MNLVSRKGIIRDGRVEFVEPSDLPEGTRVTITPGTGPGEGVSAFEFMTEAEQSDDPQAIQAWIDDLRSLAPVPWSAEDESDWRAWTEELRRFNLEAVRKQFDEGMP